MRNYLLGILLLIIPILTNAQTAQVQIIHNSPDAAAATVDVYVNNLLALNDVDFRTASAFVPLPAGIPVQVDIAPGNSTSVANSIATFNYTLVSGNTYVIVADGIVSASGYSPGNTGASAFDLKVYNMGQATAANPANVDLLVHHGATDAPAVDVVNVTGGANANLVTNASYGDFAGYLALPTADYTVEVRATGATAAVGSYEVPLSTLGLGGQAAVVVASGFLDPTLNSNGANFGLWVALPTGGPLVQLPASNARVQVIHNSADAAAASVDVYLGNTLLLDNFDFRTATPFVDIPAGVGIALAIAPSTSTSVADAIATFNYTLTANETYIIVADGIVSASGYNPGNTGGSAFDLKVYNMGQEAAVNPTDVDLLVHHGATDAPAVDVVNVTGGANANLVTNAVYGDFAGYLALPAADYRVEVRATGATTAVGSYEVPLATLGLAGNAIVTVASGFLDPTQNSNGADFGLWVALPTGGPLVQLPASTARVQVIHNSADVAAATVDVYLGNTLLLDDFTFRTASPYVDIPAGVAIDLAVAPGNSTSVASAIATFNYTLAANETYVIVADGIVSAGGYNPGNTGATAFDLKVYNMGQEAAANAAEVDVLIHHGATDAPGVDVVNITGGANTSLATNAVYGDFAGYLALPTADYRLAVRPTGSATNVGLYEAPLSTLNLQGQAIVVVASGFLNRGQNNNGAGFGLWTALPTGGPLVELPVVTARVQIIHNSGDAFLDDISIYNDRELLVSQLEFRHATPYVELPAGVELPLVITRFGTPITTAIDTFPVTLTPDETYVVVATGIYSSTGYSPTSSTVPFGLSVYAGARETATNAGTTELLFHNGGTDLGPATLTRKAASGAPIQPYVTNILYNGFSGYETFTANNDNTVQLNIPGTNIAFTNYALPLSTFNLQGDAAVLVASGFFDPVQNSNGFFFDLFIADPAGGALIQLDPISGGLQLIHNSADAALDSVDVYYQGQLVLDNMKFRSATPMLNTVAEIPITFGFAPGNSTSFADIIQTFTIEVGRNEDYIGVIDGIFSPTGYTPGNTGASALEVKVKTQARLNSTGGSTNVDVLVHHGATDAPTVDIRLSNSTAAPLVDDISYGEFDGYLNLVKQTYKIDVTNAAGTNVVETYYAPLDSSVIGSRAVTIVASGFLDPSQNSNGPAFGLWMVTTDGGDMIELQKATNSIINLQNGIAGLDLSIAPNPVVSNSLRLNSNATQETMTFVEVIDLQGRTVATMPQTLLGQGEQVHEFNLNSLANGQYILRLTTEEQSAALPFTVVK